MHRLLRLAFQPPNPVLAFGRALRRADAAGRARDWPAAEAGFARALAIDPLRADLWVQYGHAVKEQGRRPEARRAYERAAALAPFSLDAQVAVGFLAKDDGRREQAVAAFRAALALDPAVTTVRAELAALGETGPAIAAPPPPLRDVDDLPLRTREDAPVPPTPPPTLFDRALALPARLLPGRPRPPIVFFHLHKTGGLTLDDVIAVHADPARICPVKDDHLHLYTRGELDEFDILSGHFDVSALRLLRRRPRTVSLFREPRARLISFYRFHAGHDLGGRHAVNEFAQIANALDVEAFFEDPRIRRAPEVFNHYLAVFGLTYHQLRAGPPASVERVADDLLPKAIARVRGLDAIGILERFEESAALICRTLDLPAPRAVRSRNQTDALARRMTGKVPPRITMTPRLTAALDDLVRFDEPIYAAARDEFARRLAASRAV